MSHLAFDDILKPGPSLGPSSSRTNTKSRAASAKPEESSSFDNTFKRAVKELRPNEKPDTDEELDPTSKKPKQLNDPPEKRDTEQTESASKTVNREENCPAESGNEESSSVAEAEPSPGSGDPDDPDDALIAMVMATALEREEALAAKAEDVATGEDTLEKANSASLQKASLTEGAPPVIDSDLAKQIIAAQQTAASSTATDETLAETSADTTKLDTTEPNVSLQEIMARASSEAAQATASLTPEMDAAQANPADTDATGSAIQGAPAAAGASQGNAGQQGDMNLDQDSNPEEGEAEGEIAGKSQASTSNAASGQSEEQTAQATDHQQKTADTSVKTETLLDRPAATTATETRPGQETSTTSTQQTTEPTLDTTDRVRFVERVAQAFNSQSAENRAIRMRLHPEELGEIKLEMTVRNGTMHARIETETREARNVLLDNLPALRERLANLDIKVEQFDIDYNAGGDQQGTPHNPDDWSDSGQNGSNRSSNDGTNQTEEADTLDELSAPRAISRAGSGKQLDVTA